MTLAILALLASVALRGFLRGLRGAPDTRAQDLERVRAERDRVGGRGPYR